MSGDRRCPKCDLEMEFQPDEPDVGIIGGWFCHHCEMSFMDDRDDESDFMDDEARGK